MPIARFEMPDGRIARFEVPEGTTPEQAQTMMQAAMPKPVSRVDAEPAAQPAIDPRMVKWGRQQDSDTEPVKLGADAFPDALRAELAAADWGTRNIAGAGTALSNLWEGVKQFVGKGDKNAIAAQRIIGEEAPIGRLAGEVALTAMPFGMVNSVGGAVKAGAAYGALQPVEGSDVVRGKVQNAAVGGAMGGLGQLAANKAAGWVADKAHALNMVKKHRAPLDETVRDAIDAGYSVSPGQIKPTVTNRLLESASGKIATQQLLSEKNQQVTDALARKAAGLLPDDPITPETLRSARDAIKRPYQEIAALGLQKHLDDLDSVRAEATAAWREYSRQGTRQALKDYRNFSMKAKGIENSIEQKIANFGTNSAATMEKTANALTKDAGRAYAEYSKYLTQIKSLESGPAPGWSAEKIARLHERAVEQKALVQELQQQAVAIRQKAIDLRGVDNEPTANRLINEFRHARRALAMNHDVETALIEGGGSIDARTIGRMFQRGDKLTGELKTIGSFANNFRRNVQPPATMGTPDAHNLRTMASLAFGGGGMAALGPGGIAAAAVPYALPPLARSIMFSQPVQRSLLDYSLPMSTRALGGLMQQAPVGGTLLGLEAFGQ